MNNPRTYLDNIYPYVLFSQKYSFSPGQISGPRICYASSIILIEEGNGRLHLNDHVYDAKPGALFYIAPGSTHKWEADPRQPMVHRCAYFDWKYTERPEFTHQNDYFDFKSECLQKQYIGPQIHLDIPEYNTIKDIKVWLSFFRQVHIFSRAAGAASLSLFLGSAGTFPVISTSFHHLRHFVFFIRSAHSEGHIHAE